MRMETTWYRFVVGSILIKTALGNVSRPDCDEEGVVLDSWDLKSKTSFLCLPFLLPVYSDNQKQHYV